MSHSIVLAHEVDWGGWRDRRPRASPWTGVPPDRHRLVRPRPRRPVRLRMPNHSAPSAPRPAPSTSPVPSSTSPKPSSRRTGARPVHPALHASYAPRPCRRTASVGASHRPRGATRPAPRSGRSPRHPQDARLRPLPRSGPNPKAPGYVAWFEPDHYIVEANAAILRAPLRHHGVVHPDPLPHAPTGTATEHQLHRRARTGPTCRTTTSWKPIGAPISAAIFNPGSAEDRRHDVRNATQILAQPARGGGDPGADPQCFHPGRHHGGGQPTMFSPAKPARVVPASTDHACQGQPPLREAAQGSRRTAAPARYGSPPRRPCSAKGPAGCAADVHRRAARRSGGPGRPPLRRPSRADVQPRALAEAGIERDSALMSPMR